MQYDNFRKIISILRCPDTGDDLDLKDGHLVCSGHPEIKYPIINGVARFVEYGSSIGYNDHWENFGEIDVNQRKLELGKKYVDWAFENRSGGDGEIVLDIGCGDGNHIPFLPENSIKIALDYSGSVDIVSRRYADKVKNLAIIQADAGKLPIKNESIDCVVSYSCFNHLPELSTGIDEAKRVLKSGGLIAPWAYGTESAFIYSAFNALRKIYRWSSSRVWKSLIVYGLIPSLLIHKNSSGISPFKNSLKECAEIISTNLSPEYVHVFHGFSWKDFFAEGYEYLNEYDTPVGQKFIKK
ncbi:MAG: class I SAM-dependent methyltransferase [Planctomycetes bacterium]|nr:class I SAM-dependent methyltransferase [Planctomycetota bacterium]